MHAIILLVMSSPWSRKLEVCIHAGNSISRRHTPHGPKRRPAGPFPHFHTCTYFLHFHTCMSACRALAPQRLKDTGRRRQSHQLLRGGGAERHLVVCVRVYTVNGFNQPHAWQPEPRHERSQSLDTEDCPTLRHKARVWGVRNPGMKL